MTLKISARKSGTIPLADDVDDIHNVLTVHGLSLGDIAQIIRLHRDTIEELFNRFNGRDPATVTGPEAAQALWDMAENAPAVVAHVIALAADAVDRYDDVVSLPLGVQVAALEKIGEFTFAAGAGPKQVLGLLVNSMRRSTR